MKPVLVDTSVWRRYFGGAENVRALGEMLEEQDAVLVHPFVLGEMVLGGLSKQEQALFAHLPEAISVPHDEILAFVRKRGVTRRGIGWIDVHLLASALASSAALWSTDKALSTAAKELAVDFRPPAA